MRYRKANRHHTPGYVRQPKLPVREIPAMEVFAAACAAQRLNSGYLKEGFSNFDPDTNVSTTKESNKIIMRRLLNDQVGLVGDSDRTEAEAVRNYWQLK